VRENRRGQVPSSQQARDSTHGALVESMAEMRDSLRRRLERMGTELDAVRASLGGGGLRTQRTRTESTRGSSSIDVVRGVGDRSSGQIYQDFTEQMASSSRATGQSGEPSVSQREHDA
jgi:hypothetical protein